VTSRTAALRYARALFEVASQESASLESIEREIAEFSDLVAKNAALSKVLLNPAVPAPLKRGAVVELVKRAGVTPVVGKLLVLLAGRDRLMLLPELVAAYRQRLLDHQNVVRAEVTTASALSADRVKQIENSLAKATSRTITLSTRVDPTLIGGAITRIGSTVFDGSLTGQLQRMRKKLEA
jgi:F-type H+-transporting ATPase subunit delta